MIRLDADKLDALAKFLDGYDEALAAETRQMASDVRKGILSIEVGVVEIRDEAGPTLQ